MSQIRTPEIDRLYQDVLSYRSSNEFGKLLQFVKRFRHIAPYNAMLIHIQKPGSSFIASAHDWKNIYGRDIKPGARPLVILKSFGPVDFVYEYNDTYGKPLPEKIIAPFEIKTDISKYQLDWLINNIKAEGIEVTLNDYGTDSAGKIIYHGNEKILKMNTNNDIYHIKSYHTIIINKNLSYAAQYATILHELGHFFCGHLFHDHNMEKWLYERYDITSEQMEFEAETVCWLVCERLGIKNPSAEYLSGYLEENDEIPNVSVDTILKAAGIIENCTKYKFRKCHKELVVKVDKIIQKKQNFQLTLLDF